MGDHKFPYGSEEWVKANNVVVYKSTSGEAVYMKRCGWDNKEFEVSEFSVHPKGKFKGLYYSVTDANKFKKNQSSAKFVKTPKGKKCKHREYRSDAHKASTKKYRGTEKAKEVRKTWLEDNWETNNAHRRKLYKEVPGLALNISLLRLAGTLVNGEIETSPTFKRHTGIHWTTFVAHMRNFVDKNGFEWRKHGNNPEEWNIDHLIPRSAYDFSYPDDVKRCWALENIDAKSFQQNVAKNEKLVMSEIVKVGVQNWPKSWNGVVPQEAIKDL